MEKILKSKLLKVIKLPSVLISYYQEARNSSYDYIQKFQIFTILLQLYFKEIFYYKKEQVVHQKIFGYKVSAYDYNTLRFLFREIFLNQEYEATLNPEDNALIIDCGANIGLATLYFKMNYPKSQVWAFEPNPHAYQLLEKNILQNNLENVTLYNCALSNIEETISFFLNSHGSLKGSLRKERGGKHEVKVSCKKLSTFLRDKKVNLLKIDVEGAEWNIIYDLYQENMLSNVNQLIIEYHHRINGEFSRLSSFLKPLEESGFNYGIRAKFQKGNIFQDILLIFYR